MRKPICIRPNDGTVWRDGELIGRIDAPMTGDEALHTHWYVTFTSGKRSDARLNGRMRDYRGEVWFSATA